MFEFFRKNDIGEPPWDYNFLVNLDESKYPKYLAKIFKYRTGEKLPLKYDFKTKAWIIDKNKCKTFNQKIQWIKLYGVTDLMRMCTDKVAVRDYVKEKMGEEYLKPVLQIIPNDTDCRSALPSRQKLDVSEYFDQIDFDKLPNAFVIKCNYGSKWQYIIKDKENFLNTPQLFEAVKQQMTGWLEQEFFPWNGFEMQYKGIQSKIIIENFLRNNNEIAQEVEIYCFNGNPKIIKWVHNDIPDKLTIFDENLKNIDFKFLDKEFLVKEEANDYINQTFDLSIKLAKDFKFVRVDWLIFQNKIYFNEMTFTPNSGLIRFDKLWNRKLGDFIEL